MARAIVITILIAIPWLTVVTVTIGACRMAGRADAVASERTPRQRTATGTSAGRADLRRAPPRVPHEIETVSCTRTEPEASVCEDP